jgi:beta-lactamase regulating signal transducer with metallopeptidase domain
MDSGVVIRILILIVLLLLPMVPTIWAIRDIAHKSFPNLKTKVIWFVVVTLLPPIGALIYIFMGRPRVGIDGEQPEHQNVNAETRSQ